MAQAAKVLQRGDDFLSLPAKLQAQPFDSSLVALAEQLLITMQAEQGIGIAATQIGRSESLCIVASRPNARYPDAPAMPPTVLVNPEIIQTAGPVIKDWEGCLSVKGYRGLVPRHDTVRVKYFDLAGDEHIAEHDGFIARVFQHEIDHLNGVLFPDRMDAGDALISNQQFAAL